MNKIIAVNRLKRISPYTGIKTEDLYKVLMMERKDVENGPKAMERVEPGYYQGLLAGLRYFERTLGDPITSEWFENMHDVMAEIISTDVYPNGMPRGYRNNPRVAEAFYLVRGETVSEQGIKELWGRYQTMRDEEGDFVLKSLLLNPEETMQWSLPSENRDFDQLIRTYGLKQDIRKIRVDLLRHDEVGEIDVHALYLYIRNKKSYDNPCLMQRPIRRVTAIWAFNFFLERYTTALQRAKNENEALEAMVSFCQNLEQIHLFADGNVRTIGIFLLNKCLVMNGFRPTSLNDVNCLDCFSIDEIIQEIRKGQLYFDSIVRGGLVLVSSQ